MAKPLKKRFTDQRFSAKVRGIPFTLTYEEWLSIWEASGHLHERGCGKGRYCMARHGDEGPYSAENVKIIPFEENLREGMVGNTNHTGKLASTQTKMRMRLAHLGQQRSDETRENMRAAWVRRRLAG